MGDFPEARVLVFDVGGSHVSAALVCGGALSGTSSDAVDSGGTAESILSSLVELGKKVLSHCDLGASELSGVSLGFPNPFDYQAGISYLRHKFDKLYERDLRTELAYRIGVPGRKITFVNDATAYLLGEMHFGAAMGVERVIGLTLGTGVGSAFAVDGRIVTLGEGVPNGGFLWNVPYQGGILEDFISTRAIRRLFRDISGEDIEVCEIARRAAFDVDAMIAMRQFGATLGKLLKSECSRFKPDAVVLGGSISRSAQLFVPAARAELSDKSVKLLVSELFDQAALLGAYVGWHNAISESERTRVVEVSVK